MRPIFIVIQLFLMIGVPIWLALYFRRKWSLSVKILGIGAAFFIISQIVNWPLRQGAVGFVGESEFLVLVAFCIIAGVVEELCRFVAMKWVSPLKDNVNSRAALFYGFGHGGFEAVLLGLSVLIMAVIFYFAPGIVPGNDEELAKSLVEFGAMPVWHHLMGGLERLFALTIHLAASLIVAQVFLRHRWGYLFVAMGFHTIANLATVLTHKYGDSVLLTEAVACLFALISLGIIRSLREDELPMEEVTSQEIEIPPHEPGAP
jgi:uncharacterized membrane protein YhfC